MFTEEGTLTPSTNEKGDRPAAGRPGRNLQSALPILLDVVAKILSSQFPVGGTGRLERSLNTTIKVRHLYIGAKIKE